MLNLSSIPPFNRLEEFVNQGNASIATALIGCRSQQFGPFTVGTTSFFPGEDNQPSRPLYDLASLTKVIATTTSVLILLDQGLLRLDSRLDSLLPRVPADKGPITVRQLLTHTAGFEPWLPVYTSVRRREEASSWILDQPLKTKPGTDTAYSCMGFIVLGWVVETISGQRLDSFCSEHIFRPLGMQDTMFLPPSSLQERIPYTEWCPRHRQFLRGIVHDENSQSLDGVSGNAGLFSTADDLALFCRCILNGGALNSTRILSEASVKLLYHCHTQGMSEARSYGWLAKGDRLSSGGDLLSARAIGHTGFTGTSIWMDPESDSFFILLTNRVHPHRNNTSIIAFRALFHNAAAAFLSSMPERCR